MISEGYEQISVVCDDTDVFLILIHHFHRYKLKQRRPPVDVLMNPTSSSTKSISIRNTVDSLQEDVISNLLAAHALSGCDTVPQMFSIGKKKVIKVLMAGARNGTLLKCLGDLDPDLSWEAIEQQCEKFVCLLYAQDTESTSLADIRYKKWQDKAKANTMLSVLSLKYLPPTMEALKLNIKRAHYQTAIWKNVRMIEPAGELNPEDHGWDKDTANRCMVPTELPPDILLAPEYLLKVTYCGCSSENPCKTANCSCKKANVRCSDLCKCGGTCEGNGREESAADNSEEDNSDTESILYDESDNEEY